METQTMFVWLTRLFAIVTIIFLTVGGYSYFVMPDNQKPISVVIVDELVHDIGEVVIGTKQEVVYRVSNTTRTSREIVGGQGI
jgi:hypothetical protein